MDLQALVSSEEKSKLISMLCDADGNLEIMMGNFRAMQAGRLFTFGCMSSWSEFHPNTLSYHVHPAARMPR